MRLIRIEKKISKFTDAELLEKYKSGKKQIYVGELFKRYSEMTFLVCVKYLKNNDTAKDAVMDIFEILLSKLLTQEITNFRGWLYVVAKNHCLVRLKNNRNDLDINEITETEINFVENDSTLNLFDTESIAEEVIEENLNKLKELQKNCLRLFYFEKKSYLQISESENIPVNKVKSHIQNGKRNLKILLEKYIVSDER